MSFFINNINKLRESLYKTLSLEVKPLDIKTPKKTENKHTINETYDDFTDGNPEPSNSLPLANSLSVGFDDFEYIHDFDDYEDFYVDHEPQHIIREETPYIFKDEVSKKEFEYHYIGERLSKQFGFCMNHENDKYNIHFCIFTMNQKCSYQETPLPFLEFLFENKDDIFQFPTMEFQCMENVDDDVYFKNECIKFLMEESITNNVFDESMMEKIYKGFVEYDENNIFVVFDFTEHAMKQSESLHTWATVDEIVKKRINTYISETHSNEPNISNIVCDFFEKYRYMKEIKVNVGSVFVTPTVMYLCKPNPADGMKIESAKKEIKEPESPEVSDPSLRPIPQQSTEDNLEPSVESELIPETNAESSVETNPDSTVETIVEPGAQPMSEPQAVNPELEQPTSLFSRFVSFLPKFKGGSPTTEEYLFDIRIDHPILGNFFYFSKEPIYNIESSEKHRIRRFAVFHENEMIFNKDLEKITEEEKNEMAFVSSNYSTVEYTEKEFTFCCVKPDSLFTEI